VVGDTYFIERGFEIFSEPLLFENPLKIRLAGVFFVTLSISLPHLLRVNCGAKSKPSLENPSQYEFS
jgi:hypothetical protein